MKEKFISIALAMLLCAGLFVTVGSASENECMDLVKVADEFWSDGDHDLAATGYVRVAHCYLVEVGDYNKSKEYAQKAVEYFEETGEEDWDYYIAKAITTKDLSYLRKADELVESEVVLPEIWKLMISQVREALQEEISGPKKQPGFEAVFAIAGLLAVAYFLRRRGEKFRR